MLIIDLLQDRGNGAVSRIRSRTFRSSLAQTRSQNSGRTAASRPSIGRPRWAALGWHRRTRPETHRSIARDLPIWDLIWWDKLPSRDWMQMMMRTRGDMGRRARTPCLTGLKTPPSVSHVSLTMHRCEVEWERGMCKFYLVDSGKIICWLVTKHYGLVYMEIFILAWE